MSSKDVRKTFDDTYGRHALVYADGSARPAEGRIDVAWLVHAQPGVHVTRLSPDYQPKHAK